MSPSPARLVAAVALTLAGCGCVAAHEPAPTPPSPAMHHPDRARLDSLYAVRFPDELFAVWRLARELRPEAPRRAFDALGVVLCGPFDLLAGERPPEDLPMSLHWRFTYAPPELFTVASGDTDGLQWGYWFDTPESPSAVARWWARDAYEIGGDATSLHGALIGWAEDRIEGSRENEEDDPDYADEYRAEIEAATALREALVASARAADVWPPSPPRRRPTVPTPDGMGLVVDEAEVGPRLDLGAIDRRLREGGCDAIVTEARGASQPGRALGLARAVWTRGDCQDAHPAAAEVMARAYDALGRGALAEVVRAHQAHRDAPSVHLTRE